MSLNDIFPLTFDEPTAFRLRVQKSLAAALGQITTANGFVVDIGDTPRRVFRGRTIFGDNDPLPMLSILEEPISPEADLQPVYEEAVTEGDYALMVQGFFEDKDSDDPTDLAHQYLAAVKLRLSMLLADRGDRDRIFRFGPKANTVTSLAFGGGVVRPSDDVSAVAYFWLRVSITLVEDHTKPFD